MLGDTSEEFWSIRNRLLELENNTRNKGSYKYQDIKREYSVISIRAWILNSAIKEKCKENAASVLYFYSVPCEECLKQGDVFDDLISNYFNYKLRVFVLDTGVDEPMVKILKETYQINSTPSFVMGNKTYQGFMDKEQLKKLIEGEIG